MPAVIGVWEDPNAMDLWSAVRWVRAAAFAAACAELAAAGHLAGGGAADRSALLAGLLVIFPAALALTGRERTIASILPAVAGSQVLLHVLLSQAAPPHTVVHRSALMRDGTTMPLHHDGSPGLGMLLTHTVAVLVTAWWLECGESKLCGLARQLAALVMRPLLLFLLRTAAGRDAWRPAPVWQEPSTPPLSVLRHVMARRGPPVTISVARG